MKTHRLLEYGVGQRELIGLDLEVPNFTETDKVQWPLEYIDLLG